MSPTHPHGPNRTHHSHAAHPERRRSRQRHAAHPHRARARGWFRSLLTDTGRVLFCTRYGNLSRAKIISLGIVAIGVIYVLLVRGFFPFDVASPWIEAALERQLGAGHKVSIGYTKLVHDETGSPVLRVEQIRVYEPGGNIIASAPRAEIGLDGSSLLVGNFRARRIDLVGAETTVRLAADGRIAITAGREAAPITSGSIPSDSSAANAAVPPPQQGPAHAPIPKKQSKPFHYPELVRWLDSFEKSGLDGIALSEIGLKQASLVVEDADTGRKWTFQDINVQFARPNEGGLLFSLASSRADERWSLTATIAAMQDNVRDIDVVVNNLAAEDIILAAGGADLDFLAENALSGILRARIAADGQLLAANFRATAGAGIVGSAKDPEARFHVDEIQMQARFDPERNATIVEPFLIQAGANRLALSVIIEAPKGDDHSWPVTIPQGLLFLSTGREGEAPLVLDKVNARGMFDVLQRRLIVQQGNLAGATASGAFSGSVSFGEQPMLALGIAASQMPASAAKRLWPALVARNTRAWALERVESGIIDRILIALNVPLDSIGKPGVELPDSAVRLEFVASDAAFRPKADTPLLHDAQVTGVVTGRTARVRVAKAIIDTPQGRRITLSDGVLEVPDHVPPNPHGSIRFRFDGSADAVAEMAASEYLKGVTDFAVDPASAKGSVSANVQVGLVFRKEVRGDEITYAVEGDVKDFSADSIVRGQRVEGVNAKVSVTPTTVQATGSGRVAGAPTTFEYCRIKEKNEAEFRVTSTLDENMRARIGMDLAPWLAGPVQIEAQGRSNDREKRFDVEADLTAAKVADLVPGWHKAAGRAAKAAFRIVERDNSLKLEDISVTGSGTTLKGSVELDGDGNFVAANLPVFHLSDGDKASLRAERAPDGGLRVSVRGDVLDARGALRGLTEGPSETAQGRAQHRARDLDLELRLGAATGHNGEVVRQLQLRVVRRNGDIRTFSLLGKIGRDASLVGELRAREGSRPVIYVSSGDAGSLFRFADFYSRVYGGEAWIVIEPPSADGTPQEGRIHLRDFTIRGEPALDRMQAAAPTDPNDRTGIRPASQGVPFLRMQVDFNRTPGRFNIREAVIYGPTIGATVDGVLDFAANRVHLRGTYIPAFGLNNLFGQLPIVGLFLGGPKEGLFALTFEVVGPATGPTLRVNPMSAAAPGFLRKLFEFRAAPATPPVEGPTLR